MHLVKISAYFIDKKNKEKEEKRRLVLL